MKQFIVMESATGKISQLQAKDEDAAYRLYGKVVMKMSGTDDPDFDTGNVDIDLAEVKKPKRGEVVSVFE